MELKLTEEASQAIEAVARALEGGRQAVALTGAGMSTESGIPDFRSADGLWARFDPMEYATIDAFRANPAKVWRMLVELEDVVLAAQPNAGHQALAALEGAGLVAGVVTQNIDGLHQKGGSRRVVEFHGSGRALQCLRCGGREDAAAVRAGGQMPPRCVRCDAVLKPEAVLFGEEIPARALSGAEALLDQTDVMLVCGTSAEVWPASHMPHRARELGAQIFEFNLEPCLPQGLLAGRVLGPVGQTLPALVAALGV